MVLVWSKLALQRMPKWIQDFDLKSALLVWEPCQQQSSRMLPVKPQEDAFPLKAFRWALKSILNQLSRTSQWDKVVKSDVKTCYVINTILLVEESWLVNLKWWGCITVSASWTRSSYGVGCFASSVCAWNFLFWNVHVEVLLPTNSGILPFLCVNFNR